MKFLLNTLWNVVVSTIVCFFVIKLLLPDISIQVANIITDNTKKVVDQKISNLKDISILEKMTDVVKKFDKTPNESDKK